MLTQRQKEALEVIETYEKLHGIVPSYQELMELMELKSKSGIHRIITALEAKGFIRRYPNMARSYEIVERSMTPDPRGVILAQEILSLHSELVMGEISLSEFSAKATSKALREIGIAAKAQKGGE